MPVTRRADRVRATEVRGFLTLLSNLTARNLKLKYHRSFLGFVWTLLNPLATTLTLIVVFGNFVRLPIADYWAFLLSGFFVWNFINQTVSSGTYVMSQHAAVIRGAKVPPEVFPLAAVAARVIEFTAEMALVVTAIALFHHQALPASFALLPVLLLTQVLLGLALMLPIATLGAFYDDAQHSLPILMLILFYLSPVFYSETLVPEGLASVYALNPIAGLLILYHRVLYDGISPAPEAVLTMLGVSLSLCAAGVLIFRRYRRVFPEVL